MVTVSKGACQSICTSYTHSFLLLKFHEARTKVVTEQVKEAMFDILKLSIRFPADTGAIAIKGTEYLYI